LGGEVPDWCEGRKAVRKFARGPSSGRCESQTRAQRRKQVRTDNIHQVLTECAFVDVKRDDEGFYYQFVVIPSFMLVDKRRFGSRSTARKYGLRDLEFKRTYFAKHGSIPPFNELSGAQ